MVRNPFQYGSPVDAEHFAGRQRELQAVVARMTDGINVVLISPRRYGKTSLLARAEEQLRQDAAAIVHVDVLLCNSPGEFAAKLAGAAYQVPYGRWHRAKNAAAEFVHRLRVTPTVTLGSDGNPSFRFSGDLSAPNLAPVLEDVYALLAEAASKRPAVFVLDEFQAITDLGTHLPGALKALSDQYGRVSLVIAGSQRHLMERLTNSTGAPLYGMAERISLGPVDHADMTSYLVRQAKAGRKPMSVEVAAQVIETAGPIPNDIQRLAYSAYQVADKYIGADDVRQGMVETVTHDASTYAKTYQSFTAGQRRVLGELAASNSTKIFSGRFARLVHLANAASVNRVVDALSADETITSPEGRWVVTDPFFAFWLREFVAGGLGRDGA